jgi:hypothetical protein
VFTNFSKINKTKNKRQENKRKQRKMLGKTTLYRIKQHFVDLLVPKIMNDTVKRIKK